MKRRREQLIFAMCMVLCFAVSSCSLLPRARLSGVQATRIAQERISHDFVASSWNYRRVRFSYLPEERIWVVSYQEKVSGAKCIVEVDDRTGQSRILIP
jgi:hypothetical protein